MGITEKEVVNHEDFLPQGWRGRSLVQLLSKVVQNLHLVSEEEGGDVEGPDSQGRGLVFGLMN